MWNVLKGITTNTDLSKIKTNESWKNSTLMEWGDGSFLGMSGISFVCNRRPLVLEPQDLNLNPIPVTTGENKSWTSHRASW